jgi:hypothetical protein
MFTIYKHTTPSGKVYIGQTKQKLWERFGGGYGYHGQDYFWKAIQKHGWQNITHEVLAQCYTQEEADKLEAMYIEEYNSTNREFGYNIQAGGAGDRAYAPLTPEHKAKISAATKGIVRSAETRAKMSEARKARPYKPLSDEHKQHLSESLTGRKMPPEAIEKTRLAAIGRKHTEEAKRKMSIAHSGKTLSEEHKRKTSETLTGYKRSAEEIKKSSDARRGQKRSEETRKRMSESAKGKKKAPFSKEHIANMKKAAVLREAKKREQRLSGKGAVKKQM